MKKIRMFKKTWWVIALFLFVSVTLLFPISVQADPGTINPPRKKTTMYAEVGEFYAPYAFTVLFWNNHTHDDEIVHFGSPYGYLPIIA